MNMWRRIALRTLLSLCLAGVLFVCSGRMYSAEEETGVSSVSETAAAASSEQIPAETLTDPGEETVEEMPDPGVPEMIKEVPPAAEEENGSSAETEEDVTIYEEEKPETVEEEDEILEEDQEEDAAEEEEDEEERVSGEEVAEAIKVIFEASSQMDYADQAGVERLQDFIEETQTALAELTEEEQAALSVSTENLEHASVAVDAMQESMEQMETSGTIVIPQTGLPNSWRFINGVPIEDALEVIEQETVEVIEAAPEPVEAIPEEGLLQTEEEGPGVEESAAEEPAAEEPAAEEPDLPAEEPVEEIARTSVSGDLTVFRTEAGGIPRAVFTDAEGVKQGIDVSSWQDDIDWAKVRQTGIDFVILRCGYGSDYTSQDDKKWAQNVAACEKYGIPYGVYLYSYASDMEMIDSEVAHTLRLLKGHTPQLPVYLDVEENAQLLLGDATLSKMAERYCSQISAAGYRTGVYSSLNWWNKVLTLFSQNSSYYHWIAQWHETCTYGGRFECWQYTNDGEVAGIEGNVDLNLWYGAFPSGQVTPAPTPSVTTPPEPQPKVAYRTHVQNLGWEGSWKQDGQMSGTSGRSLRLEGIQITVTDDSNLGIRYRTHVQDLGWENGWYMDGNTSGTTGQSKRLEAIQIELTGSDASKFDVYYCVHVQNLGWMNWAKNGESAGSAGYSYRLEGIRIKLVKKGEAAPVKLGRNSSAYLQTLVQYNTHVQDYGWLGYAADGALAGTTGQSKRLEGMHIQLSNQPYSGGIEYRTHIQNIGWESGWKRNGAMTGTSGRSLRLEAIQIRLTGEMEAHYDVWYQTHIQNFGWSGWARNGVQCGSAGYSYRLEAIRICLVPKGGAAPGSTAGTFHSR